MKLGLTHLPRKKASVIQWFTFGLRKSCEILKISERLSKLRKFCKYTNEVSVSEVTKLPDENSKKYNFKISKILKYTNEVSVKIHLCFFRWLNSY